MPIEKRTRGSEREALRLIEEMLAVMESRGLVELELEHQGMRVRLKKAAAMQAAQVVEYVTGIAPQAAAPGPGPAAPAAAKLAGGEEAGRRVVVKSPMVGVFYRSPAPDAPPFIEVGQDVEAGQVICIIEAMKLMNEIKSEATGRVVDILAANGDPVEFGQPLVELEPR